MKTEIIKALENHDHGQLSPWPQQLAVLAAQGKKEVSEQNILHSLRYRFRETRPSKIVQSHESTLDWIFKDKSSSASSSKPKILLKDWLSSGVRAFRVAGKSGSGKSALVKYLSYHSETYELLQQWGGSKKVTTASCYFWSTEPSFRSHRTDSSHR